jgi:hypothetical protein
MGSTENGVLISPGRHFYTQRTAFLLIKPSSYLLRILVYAIHLR